MRKAGLEKPEIMGSVTVSRAARVSGNRKAETGHPFSNEGMVTAVQEERRDEI